MSSTTAPSATTRILIVEDEALIAEELADRLRRLGHAVVGQADCAEDALASVREERPDLVFMDIRLKGRRDGISVAAELYAEYGIPVVYLTAHSDGETVRRARETAPFGYVLKPFQERDLLVAIEVAMQRHGVERRLRESEARYATTLASIGDGVIATDAEGQVTFMNAVAESLTGWSLGEARGRDVDGVLALIGEDDTLPRPNPVRRALETRSIVHCTERLLLLDRYGERIPFEDCAAPIHDVTGDTTGAVLAFRDASDRRRAEVELETARERLRRAERLETLGRLAGGVAHDFNNLLTVIQESVELLHEPSSEAERAELLESIAGACTRGAALTERLFAAGRRTQRAPVVLDLNEVVRATRTLLARILPETIRLRVDLASSACPVEGDAGLLESALLNLATNARDAMREGGTLRIETALVQIKPGEFVGEFDGQVPPGRYVRLVVADTGTGLSLEARANLCEPFFTTKPVGEGTGLGLTSVKGIVRQAGGFLDVESVPGIGTTFRVYLPEQEATRLPPAASAATGDGRRGIGRVLLVEDDRAVRAVTRQALELHGYEVSVAGDVAEGLARAREGRGFQLLVTDVGLPDGSGVELARQLREEFPALGVVVMSGYSEAFSKTGRLPEDARVLDKPFTAAELTRIVREVLVSIRVG